MMLIRKIRGILMPKRLYIASPLGFSEAGRIAYPRVLRTVKSAGYAVLDPWTLTPKEWIDAVISMPEGPKRKKGWERLNKLIGHNNSRAIQQSDGIVAVLDGVDVDSGVAAEVGYGAALEKRILGYRGDFRLTGENEGAVVNLQVEYFIRLHNGIVVRTLDELKKNLKKVFG